jgi:hypothetical protein
VDIHSPPRPVAAPVRVLELAALLLTYLSLAAGVAVEHGHFSPTAIALVCLGSASLVVAAATHLRAAAQQRERRSRAVSLEKLLAVALVLVLIGGIFDAPGYYLQSRVYRIVFIAVQLGLAAAVGAGLFAHRLEARLRHVIFAAGVTAGFGLRIGMISASPAPRIDVFTQFQESAAHVLHGLNPYSTSVSDPYHGTINYGYHVTGYAYPPANLYPQTAAYLLLGDIRYACILFECVAIAALYALVPVARRAAGQLLVLLFLFHPRGLFVIEQAWTEPLLVGAAGIFLWLAAIRPASRWVPVVFGFFLSLKQYLVFFAVLYFGQQKRWRLLLPVTAIVLLTWLPFLLWDARSAVDNGLLFQFRTAFRPDGLTLSSVAFRWFGWQPTKWVAIGIGLAVTGAAWKFFQGRGLGGYLYASLLATLAAFLVGSQAFCNYYYFLGTLVLFLIAVRLREEESHAA